MAKAIEETRKEDEAKDKIRTIRLKSAINLLVKTFTFCGIKYILEICSKRSLTFCVISHPSAAYRAIQLNRMGAI